MSQNRRKKSNQRRKTPGPLGGGGPPPGSNDNYNYNRNDAAARARRYSTIVAIIMLLAIVIPVIVGACVYRDTGAAYYNWSDPAQSKSPSNLGYVSARYLKRDTAESAPTASLAAPQSALADNQIYVGETGHYLANGFLTYWRNKGGASVFGNPLSEEFQQNGRTVQLFERALFEYHAEAKNTPNEVQLGFLGRQLAETKGLQFTAASVPTSTSSTITYFSETTHTLRDPFKSFWEKNNGIFLLGFPISEELNENGVQMQYFERGRLELAKDGQTQKVVFSNAGDALIAAKGWSRPTKIGFDMDIDTNEIWQGRTLSMRLFNDGWNWPPQKLQGTVGKDPLHFAQIGSLYKAFEAFAPNIEPKTYPLNIQFFDPAGRQRQLSRPIEVVKFDFELQRLTIPDDKSDTLSDAAEESDTRILTPVYNTFTPQVLWSGKWNWPVTGPLSTEFGMRRIYNDLPQDPNYYHAGLDIAVNEGTPVAAPAAGKVVYTGTLQVRGNAIGVDHGMGVISFYYHLSAINVKVGQEVKPGDILGRVGTTGRSDGPHLHWEVRVNGIATDPRTFQKLDLSN